MGERTEERIKIAGEAGKLILDKFEPYISRIWIFGSVARGEDKEGSDIDIEVLLKNTGLPLDWNDVPFGYSGEITKIEKSFRKRGYIVNFDTRDYETFVTCIRKRRTGDYKRDFEVDVLRDKIELYNQRKALGL